MKRILVLSLFVLAAIAAVRGAARSRVDTIGPARSAEIVSFTATPRTIKPGESVTLAWETRGAASVTLKWSPERRTRAGMQRRTGLPPSGTLRVEPEEDTIYVLECEQASGQVCMAASASIRVR
jgi:hypothetical protein